MCVSAACKNDRLSSVFADFTDSLRRGGGKQRDCNLETRTSWGFILTLWHLQLGKWKGCRMISFTWSLRLTPPPLPPCLSSIFKGEDSEMYFKKLKWCSPKPKPLIKWLDLPDRRVRALALFSVSSKVWRKKVHSHLRMAIWVYLSYLKYLPSGPWEQALWSGTKAEGTWSLLTNPLSPVILTRRSLNFFFL